MARRAWYKASEYKGVFPERKLNDGSLIECVQGDSGDEFLLTRRYPWGFVQRVRFRLLPNGETRYIDVSPGPESPNQLHGEERTKAFEQHLQNGEVRITARGPIPGAGVGVTYDSATRKHYHQSEEFEKEFDRMKLTRLMGSDQSTRHMPDDDIPSGPSKVGGVEPFAVNSINAAPPLPRGAKR